MSTSPRLAAHPVPSHAEVEPFPYAALTDSKTRAGQQISSGEAVPISPAAADESASLVTQAKAQAQREGFAQAQKMFEEQLARERASLAAALSQFKLDRTVYFQKVEGEIVQLALSIARKILHREAQVDPLLLVGIVRVALEQIDGATEIVLRVHPTNAPEWCRALALQLDPADMPKVVEDPSQARDTCVLETAMGTAVLGLEVQLKEIEHGLMDLLSARPGATP